MKKIILCGVIAVLAATLAGNAGTVKPVVWSPHAISGCLMNMGPTGARVWMRGYQYEVRVVDAGSPADGLLLPGDQVVGVESTLFAPDVDSRMTLGNAIGRAEAADGALTLAIQRAGQPLRVTIKLPVTGPFSTTWPYGCAKSQRILDEACFYLREAQLPEGSILTDGGTGTYLSGLLFLASGEPRFRDAARRAVYATAASELEKQDYHNWALGYGGLLLAEYYLATGDTNVLARLKAITDHIARGQMQCGSWGHKGPSGGYGALNQPGLACTITLVLAQECGVDVDRTALQRAVTFFGRYAELGSVPYGDHMPGVSWPDDNGKSSLAAVLFALLPDGQEAASAFVKSVATSYWLREEGHTGGFFSLIWGPIACGMARADEFQTFMDYQGWYYNLARTWRGAVEVLPYHEALTRFDNSTYTSMGGEFTTGGMALSFALPYRQLRILGAPRSVFGAKLSGPLLNAREAYQARQWPAFEAAVASARAAGGSPEEKRWLTQLEAAATLLHADTTSTLKEIENNITEGDAARASEQYLALKRFLGDQDATSLALDKRFADATVQWHTRVGKQYYKAWNDLRGITIITWLPYGEMARAHVGEVPRLRPRMWETLVPVSGKTAREWRKVGDGQAVAGELSFVLDSTRCAALRLQLQSPRNAHTRVSLNGTQVAEALRGQRSGYAGIELDPGARSLLRIGTNVLAISSTSTGSAANALDMGLDVTWVEQPLPMTPARPEGAVAGWSTPELLRTALETARRTFPSMPLALSLDPAVPERMGVRDSQTRFRTALDKAFDALPMDALNEALRSPVAFWRYLAGQSLTRRGAAGMQVALTGLTNSDWRVRSACCDVLSSTLAAAVKAGGAGAVTVVTPVDPAWGPRLTGLVGDDHAWVRCRAAGALGALGKADVAAATALAKAATDSDPWVRATAVGALSKVTDDPRILVQAAAGALMIPDTSFAVVGRSLPLIEKYGAGDKAAVASLIFAIEHPGEGAGINNQLELLVKLDPGGTNAIPVLTKVAAGGYAYDRLKGNAPKRAAELLVELGQKPPTVIPAPPAPREEE